MTSSVRFFTGSVFLIYAQNNWPSLASIGQFFYILLLVAFVALLAYYSTKLVASSKKGRRGLRRNLELIECVSVNAQSALYIVRAGYKYLLIGVTKDRIAMLTELDGACLDLSEARPFLNDASFDKMLQKILRRDKPAADIPKGELCEGYPKGEVCDDNPKGEAREGYPKGEARESYPKGEARDDNPKGEARDD